MEDEGLRWTPIRRGAAVALAAALVPGVGLGAVLILAATMALLSVGWAWWGPVSAEGARRRLDPHPLPLGAVLAAPVAVLALVQGGLAGVPGAVAVGLTLVAVALTVRWLPRILGPSAAPIARTTVGILLAVAAVAGSVVPPEGTTPAWAVGGFLAVAVAMARARPRPCPCPPPRAGWTLDGVLLAAWWVGAVQALLPHATATPGGGTLALTALCLAMVEPGVRAAWTRGLPAVA